MAEPLWVEVDEEGQVLRASDAVRARFEPHFGSDLGLPQVFALRPDVRAAVIRKAGKVRFGLGNGEVRTLFDAMVDEGGKGSRIQLTEAPELDLSKGLVGWALSCDDGVVVLDADHVVLWANSNFCEQVGYPEHEVVGIRYSSFHHAASIDERTQQSMSRALVGTGTWSGSLVHRKSDGTSFPVRIGYTALSEGGTTTNYVVTCTDLQEENELELLDALDSSAALLSRMGMGFAHDINNLASELVGVAELARSGDEAAAEEALARVEELGEAAGEVGRQLLVLAGEGTDPPPSDLAQAARDLRWLLIRASSRTRPIDLETPVESLWVGVRADAMLRTILRPALRAVAELPPHRVLRVTAEAHNGVGLLSIQYEADATERAKIRRLISDGVVTSHAGNILKTRAMGAGVELNLDADQTGNITISAQAPLSDGPMAASEEHTGESRTWKRVLVIEDNQPLRDLMHHALRPVFDHVELAADGVAGLEALEAHHDDLDLVIVDLMMPRLNGSELIRTAHKRWPDLPFVAVSGGAPQAMVEQHPNVAEFLLKPFKLRNLRRCVYRVLSRE